MSRFSSRKNDNTLERLQKEAEKLNKSSFEPDTRFWYPERDKSGNAYAVIRFLPAAETDGDDANPWVRLWSHGFKGPTGSWYIENCLTTIGQPDPVSEDNTRLWNMDTKEAKDIARDRKRRLNYISNIYIVQDSKNPDNEGKVFLFKYGKRLFAKLDKAMHPQFEDEEAFDPFNFFTGANFKLKVCKVDGQTNYDSSEFMPRGPLFKDDSKVDAIGDQLNSLKELVAPDKFKSYDELKRRFLQVVGMPGEGNIPFPVSATTTPKPTLPTTVAEEVAPFDEEEKSDSELYDELKNLTLGDDD